MSGVHAILIVIIRLWAAGGWMAFTAGDLARMFSWLRSAGLPPPDKGDK